MAMKDEKLNCRGMEPILADLLFDPTSVSSDAQAHLAACAHCTAELAGLRATMDVLDAWQTPEPNPYFMTRFEARLREEKAAPRLSFWARLRSGWVYGPHAHARPVTAMALTALLLLGGGAYLGTTNWEPAQAGTTAAAVSDLQTMDKNAELLDQLEALSNAPDADSDTN